MSKKAIVIAVQPKCYRFKEQAEGQNMDALRRILQAQDSTEPVEINCPEDVMLNRQGKVQRTFRLTTTALSQLCSALAPGLSQLVGNLSGLRRKDTEDDEWKVYDPLEAIHIINNLIRLRFKHRLEGHGLIMDMRNARVEGVVGPRYKFLSNLELLDRANEFARDLDPSARFLEAALAGRRLVLRYRDATRLFSLPAPNDKREPFYRGWHFSNSEIGDCSVRTGMLIVRQWRRTSSLMGVGRLVHVKGGNFGPKINDLFQKLQRTADSEINTHNFSELADDLQQESLRLGGDPVAHVKRSQSLIGKLARGKFPKLLAKRTLNHALASGSYRVDRVEGGQHPTYDAPDPGLLGAFRGRNAYDLYNALTEIARGAAPEQQELAESLAYKLLLQRFKVHN